MGEENCTQGMKQMNRIPWYCKPRTIDLTHLAAGVVKLSMLLGGDL